jgi:hypothetical protein
MATINNPQFDGWRDTAVAAIANGFDTYGWPVLASLLAVLFLGVMVVVSLRTDLELIDFESVSGIYRFVRSLRRRCSPAKIA